MKNKNYKWDIESILEGKTLNHLFDLWRSKNDYLVELYPCFLDSLELFKKWLKVNEEEAVLSNRVYNYISNSLNENLSSAELNGWMQKLQMTSVIYSEKFSDYENRVLKNKNKIIEYLKDDEISEYKRYFEKLFKFEKYVLDDKSEKLLTTLSSYNSGFDDIYSSLIDNDFKYNSVYDSKGNLVQLKTQADIFKNLKSHDNLLRERTWLSFHSTLDNFKTTLTKSLYYNYLMLNTNAKIRGFKDYIESTAFSDEIEPNFINHVYKNVKKFKNNIDEFNTLRKKAITKMFNIEEFKPWDAYLELKTETSKYSIEQAQNEVLEALSILGEKYTNVIKKAFDEKWISWLPSESKQTGAYSIGGIKGLKKYFISMNFDETLNSVYTLAHELGHSANSYFISQKQKIYQGCSIFYAEISSIANEMFLNYHLLKKYDNDKKLKLMIYDEMISGFIATTTRQVIFSEFEYEVNKLVNNHLPFTYESISNTYLETIKKYMDSNLEIHKFPEALSLLTPLRISHFYVGNFYVYKYAIGQVAAVIIAEKIKNNESKALEKYFDFLSSGNSLSPLDTIKLLGIDLTSDQAWDEANKILINWINEYKKLLEEVIEI